MSDPNGDVPQELADEKGIAKIVLAGAVVATIIGGFVAVMGGYIPDANPASSQIVTLFVTLAGAAVGFFLGKKA